MTQGYNQIKGINFEETFTLVARLEIIHMTLAYACYIDFKLYQMYVKNAFLHGYIEEVCVEQLRGSLILHTLTMCSN